MTAEARAQDAKERYLAEVTGAQKSLQERTGGAEERADVSEEQAVAAETVETQQQQEERSTVEAAQAPVQQGRSTMEQQQQDDAAARRNLAAEPHAAATRPGNGEQIAEWAQQIKAVASSAMQKMHGIRAHASMWWNKRRRSSTENASHVEEAASNDGGQQKEEIGPLEAPAPREDQPAESSMPAAEKEKEEARTHFSGSPHAEEAFTAQPTRAVHASGGCFKEPNLAKGESSAHCNALPRYWSFGGRSGKPRARDMFTAPSWGIKKADIEMGATIYRRKRAERWGESHKLAPTPLPTPAPRGGGHLHPLRGVGEGTDGLRVGPRQLARTSGPVNLIADRGQRAQWVAQMTPH